jgi:uncharacterized OB-fold protein
MSGATRLASVGTYLPPWGDERARVAGPDEDAVTMAVAAGRAALSETDLTAVRRVVLVTRDLPLAEGGNGAVLLAGIGLPDDLGVVERVGGAPAALDALVDAAPGTLVVAADCATDAPVGAAAALVTGPDAPGAPFRLEARTTRSLPVRARGRDGAVHDYEDPRLLRERGVGAAVERLALSTKPEVAVGLPAKQAAAMCTGTPPPVPTLGASSPLFAIAALAERGRGGLVLAVEQASAVALALDDVPAVHREEPDPAPLPKVRTTPGPEIAISLAAYERAFESKLRWEAGRCDECRTLALPPRHRCLGCGAENAWRLVPLPRTGVVYSQVTIHVPVPGLATPYSLAIVELDGTDRAGADPVRALVKVTGVPAGTVDIDDHGQLVLRRVAVRSGVPDYGYALLPERLARPDTITDRTLEAAR